MKKVFLLHVTNLIVGAFFLLGCTPETFYCNDEPSSQPLEIVGSTDFINAIISSDLPRTKSGELSADDISGVVNLLLPPAIDYLYSNDFDYHEEFCEGDPNIILAAYCLLAYDSMSLQTKGAINIVMDCVVTGAGLKEILTGSVEKMATRALIKLASKELAKRAVPYVGTGIFVVSTTACLIDEFTGGSGGGDCVLSNPEQGNLNSNSSQF